MLLAAYANTMTAVETSETPVDLRVSVGAEVSTEVVDGLLVLTARNGSGPSVPLMFSLETPLGDAEGFWHPNARHGRTLPADWAGRQDLNLVSSTPVGVLYDKSGAAVLAYACDEAVDEITLRYGVCEETNTFVVHLELASQADGGVTRLALALGQPEWTSALAALRDWLASDLAIEPLPVPPAALEPVYSTWYTFSQDINAADIEADAEIAASIGCGSVFIDDGWELYASGRGYAGCGDWLPDPDEFPDLAGHVQRLHDLGLSVVLWIAPLLLGEKSAAFAELGELAPHHVPHLETHILDPRRPEVRDHVVATCLRLMRDYGLDGLKIDFLDQATVYQGRPTDGDTADAGVAMLKLLQELRVGLTEGGWDAPLLEYRQPYVSPALAPFGNILRVGDCPADTAVNRASMIDLRLLDFGPVVHSDMLMWDGTAAAEVGARQLLNVFFSVPQISMRLTELGQDHLDSLTFLLQQWRSVRDVVLQGQLSVGLSNDGYPVIQSWSSTGEGVLGVYADAWVSLDLAGRRRLTVLNASGADSVVLDLAGPVQVRATTFTATGREQTTFTGSWEAGLMRLPVPVCGLAVVEIS
ncbi:MAG: glycoside hydrolase family 36 protein [Propionibacteriaceae bacterium]